MGCKLRRVPPALIRFDSLLSASVLFFPNVDALVPVGGQRQRCWGDYSNFKSSTQLSIVLVSPGDSPWSEFTVITYQSEEVRRREHLVVVEGALRCVARWVSVITFFISSFLNHHLQKPLWFTCWGTCGWWQNSTNLIIVFIFPCRSPEQE